MSIFNLKSEIRIACPKRIAPFLEKEVRALGFVPDKVDDTGIDLTGTLADCMRLNLWLRTAHRVLFLIDEFEASTPDQLYENLVKLPWEEYIPSDGYITIGSHVLQDSINDTRFANLRVKDAIVDRMTKQTGKRPDSGPEDSRTVLFLHWKNDQASIFFDTSGETLSRHGYRKMPWKAPMQETLAAAAVIATGYTGAEHFVNPMCGSGTLAIEAALIATNTAPGLLRENFGFMHLRGYIEKPWKEMRRDAEAMIDRRFAGKIIATDIHGGAMNAARDNAKIANVNHLIEFRVASFEETFLPSGKGILIMNPAYGDRLGEVEELEPLYKEIGNFMKQKAQGYMAYIFTGNMDLAKVIGLKAKRRIEFYNSKIDCRLLEYELYTGSRRPERVVAPVEE
jgi:23S rRNA G2445 N2-methylase RlmL